MVRKMRKVDVLIAVLIGSGLTINSTRITWDHFAVFGKVLLMTGLTLAVVYGFTGLKKQVLQKEKTAAETA